MGKWIIGSNAFYLSCSNCDGLSSEATNYCPHCGEKMKETEITGFCEDCEYMHELVFKSDEQKILRPECWASKTPTRVNYRSSCGSFKMRKD